MKCPKYNGGELRVVIKDQMEMTIHNDGTVSFWSVLRQSWERKPLGAVKNEDVATMPEQDRQAILWLVEFRKVVSCSGEISNEVYAQEKARLAQRRSIK